MSGNIDAIKTVLSNDSGFVSGLNRDRTLNKYAQLLDVYIGLDLLESADALAIIERLKSSNLKVSTKKLIYCAARKWFLLKGKKDIVRTLEDDKPVYNAGENKRYLSYSEYLILVDACKYMPIEDRILIEILITTGMRPSAVIYMLKSDIKDTSIYIPGDRIGNKFKKDYYVDVPQNTMILLKAFIDANKKKDAYVFGIVHMFLSKKIKEETLSSKIGMIISNAMSTAQKKAKTPNSKKLKFNPYILRHTFGVIHYNAYNDILKTKVAMGQKNVSATEKYAVSDDTWKKYGKKVLKYGFE